MIDRADRLSTEWPSANNMKSLFPAERTRQVTAVETSQTMLPLGSRNLRRRASFCLAVLGETCLVVVRVTVTVTASRCPPHADPSAAAKVATSASTGTA
jgi:hypothetical protein